MKRFLIPLAIIALIAAPQLAFGSDVDDLKAAYENAIQAWNTLDAEALAATLYPGMVSFDYNEAFPSVTNTEADAIKKNNMMFSGMEFFQLVTYNVQYKVVGNTGIAWGNFTFNVKPKGESAHLGYGRHTSTWIKKDGKWHIIMNHSSAIPTGY